jgi:hypothetical protein
MNSLVGRSSAGPDGSRPKNGRCLLRAGAGSFFCWAASGAMALAVLPACTQTSATAPRAPAEQAHGLPKVRELSRSGLGGAETCFNATDDNDNSLIDEGCDVRQGDVHFMVAWPDPSIDVDLLVVDPSGSLAGARGPSAKGLVLSDDCPRAGGACSGQAFESVYLDDEDVPSGTYRVRIVVVNAPGAPLIEPLPVRFGARLPGTSVAREIEFTEAAREIDWSFEVESAKNEEKTSP